MELHWQFWSWFGVGELAAVGIDVLELVFGAIARDRN